jgi:gamma-glutamyl:cysteine ligase YbdK (ATP-grasp superfamily)
MIVDTETLAVKPVCDKVLSAIGGGFEVEVERGECAWSNELALHVLEVKTNGPAPELATRAAMFQENLDHARSILEPEGATLLPTGMHPWMDPFKELVLWPHEYGAVYRAYHRIFDCRGHGWANLQSAHLNLPFHGDEEFGRLHAAIRLVLPLIPGLTASSPMMDGRLSGLMDSRLYVYGQNSRRVPEVTGVVIPEAVFTRKDYETEILGKIYQSLASFDPEGVLRHEWANSRGAIARFDRMAIEIRLVDTQENPRADLALLALITAAIQGLVEERWCSYQDQCGWDHRRLAAILLEGTRHGEEALIEDVDYCRAFGYTAKSTARVRDLWEHLVGQVLVADHAWESEWREPVELYLEQGCLARRMTRSLGVDPDQETKLSTYRRLARCLAEGELFHTQER